MKQEEYNNFNTLFETFVERCNYIIDYLYNHDYIDQYHHKYLNNFEPEDDQIHCFGDDYEGDYVYFYFPSYLLWGTDEDINKFIKDERKKKEEEKKREQQKKKEDQRKRDLETLARLKAKYEPN